MTVNLFNLGSRSFQAGPAVRTSLMGVLAVLGSVGASAAQKAPAVASSIQAKQGDAESLWLTVSNPSQQRLHLQVTHLGNQNNLMDEVNHEESYGCKLKFGLLPAGQYSVQVRVGHERYRYHVQVQAQPQSRAPKW